MPNRAAVVALMLALAPFNQTSFASPEPPKKFADIAEILGWVEGNKGFGARELASSASEANVLTPVIH